MYSEKSFSLCMTFNSFSMELSQQIEIKYFDFQNAFRHYCGFQSEIRVFARELRFLNTKHSQI